jgi:hypothetical protein
VNIKTSPRLKSKRRDRDPATAPGRRNQMRSALPYRWT